MIIAIECDLHYIVASQYVPSHVKYKSWLFAAQLTDETPLDE
jgi:hypothetical protein